MKNVIAMAGRGHRFGAAGYSLPKPLIDVCGAPMVCWAVRSLPSVPPQDLIFVISAQHAVEFHLAAVLRELFSPEITVVLQQDSPHGQAVSVLLARSMIDTDEPLIIYNCDTYAPGIGAQLQNAAQLHPSVDGFIPVFKSQADNLSYIRTDNEGMVVEVAEKRVISCDATIGLYHFARGADFVWAADRMIAAGERVNNEFYVLPVYRYLMEERERSFRKLSVNQIHVLGTPEELEAFKRHRAGAPGLPA